MRDSLNKGGNAVDPGKSKDQDIRYEIAPGQEIIEISGDVSVADAKILRHGHDLILENSDGSLVTIDGYFLAEPPPSLVTANGQTLSPSLINSFAQSAGPAQYAQAHV